MDMKYTPQKKKSKREEELEEEVKRLKKRVERLDTRRGQEDFDIGSAGAYTKTERRLIKYALFAPIRNRLRGTITGLSLGSITVYYILDKLFYSNNPIITPSNPDYMYDKTFGLVLGILGLVFTVVLGYAAGEEMEKRAFKV